jgi:hypothetical protein
LDDPDRVRAWREDLAVAVDSFLTKDRSFSAERRAAFRSAVGRLQGSVAAKTDNQIIAELARAVALSENAHTRLYLVRIRTALRRYPVRVYWFRDGLYVVKTTPEHRDLLGRRVVSIAGRDPVNLRQVVAPLFAGNASWRTYMSTYSLTCPDLLEGLGVIDSSGIAAFEVEREGRRIARRIEPLPLEIFNQPTEAWWDLSPLHAGRGGPWLAALPAERDSLPLYLRNPRQQYWSERLPAARAFYIQYNRSGDMPAGESLAEFGARTLRALTEDPADKVIVDLRFNTGGNLAVADGFLRQLASLPGMKQRGRLFVIISGSTFSAGIYHTAELEQLTGALLVGEPVGDVLDFWAEGGNVVMPHSRLTPHYADGFHSYTKVEHPEFEPYYMDLGIDSLEPDLRVDLNAADYFARRDPALDRVLHYR